MADVWTETYEGSGHSNANWDGPTAGSGCTYDADASPPGGAPSYWGSQSLHAVNTASASDAYNTGELASAESLLYVQFAFYVDAHGIGDGSSQPIFNAWDSGWTDALQVNLYNDGGQLQLRVIFRGTTDLVISQNIAVDTFYDVEVKFDAAGGTYEVWLATGSGSPGSIASGSLPGGHRSNLQPFIFGLFWEAYACDVYLDLLRMADAARIGLPSGGTEHPLAGSAGVALSAGGALSVTGQVALSGAASMSLSGAGALSGGSASGAFYKIYVDWDDGGDFTGTYDDVTDDRVGAVRYRLGFSKAGDRMASVGTARFALDNSWFNQHGALALYSKDNAASPLAGKLVPMRRVKIAVEVDGVETVLWTGFVEEIVPGADEFVAEVSCVDRLAALDVKVDIALQTNRRANQLISILLGEAFDSLTKHFVTGPIIYQQAGDNWLPEETNVYQAVQEVVEAEHARFWFDAKGEATYWDAYREF